MSERIQPRMDGPIARCTRDCPSHGHSTFEQYDPSQCAITGLAVPRECGPWYRNRIAELEAALATAREDAVREPIRLAIYTSDDGRIASVVEQDVDGDPCDREIDATAVIAHADRAVERYEGLMQQWSRACEIAMKHCGKFAPDGRSVFEYIPVALATAREDAVREFAEWLEEESLTLADYTLDDSDMFSGAPSPAAAAERYLTETGKEPK